MTEHNGQISSLIESNDDLQITINRLSTEILEVKQSLNRCKTELETISAERDKVILDLQITTAELGRISSSRLWRVCLLLWSIKRQLRTTSLVVKVTLNPRTLPHRVYQKLPSPLRGLIRQCYLRLRRVPKEMLLPQSQVFPQTSRPETLVTSCPDYIVCGGIDWHFRQNRSRNLSHELAASGRRVFYVTPELIDDDHPGFEFEQLDETSRLFQIRFHGQGGTLSSHTSPPNGELVSQLRIGLGEMLEWAGTTEIVSIVQHPSWFDAVRVLPNSRLVYDCIDHFGRVGNPGEALLNLEKTLLRQADLTITSLTYLDQFVAPFAARRAVIKNGCQFEHFASAPAGIFRDSTRRKVIGYFGAITEWFDQDLVAAIAKRFPETLLLLIGNDKVNAGYRLGVLPNVRMIGEVPYKDLPYFVHGFDVSILPLKIEPLTLATNQVNVYEYLSIGKPVVAVDLPEMAEFADLVNVARDPDKFLSNIANLLSKPVDRQAIRRRRQFAQTQTWSNRANCLISEIERLDAQPLVSVIVVTYNNLQLTRTCLASLDEQSAGLPLELIVVDNQSTDGSREFLSEWSKQASNRRLIINEDNRGFAAANNQGLAVAGGDYLVLLNNDTHVTPGWARTLVTHLRQDESIGLIGPVTNNIGNEAKIDITYDNMNEMLTAAASYTRKHVGMLTPLRTAAFFCVMFSRNTYQHVGILDENFGRGFFEDDDYCRRVEQYGRRIVCAEDVFVHHQLSASFNKLFQPERIELFERNKAYYESKWGKWIPHQAR